VVPTKLAMTVPQNADERQCPRPRYRCAVER
jgi:hypothetical protein